MKIRQRLAAGAVAATLAIGGGVAFSGVLSSKTGSTPKAVAPVPEYTPTVKEAAAWSSMTDTPLKRAQVTAEMQEAFAGVADVSLNAPPTLASASSTVVRIRTVVSYGITWSHFWVTASYADMARGAIWGAVQYCKTRLPAWLCQQAGNILSSWASGWPALSNHGVWAAVYWAPPYITGGRW